jgi:hypothetical protein
MGWFWAATAFGIFLGILGRQPVLTFVNLLKNRPRAAGDHFV